MRVVVIANARQPIAQPFSGGLESMSWHLVRGLRARGVQVEVFAGPGSDPALGARVLPLHPVRLSEAALRDRSMPQEDVITEHFAYQDLMLALSERTDVDVIHNNCLHPLPPAMSRIAAAPMLTTLHTPPTPWLEPVVRRIRDPRARFVAVSRGTRRAWAPAVDCGMIHNGVDTSLWQPGPGGEDLVWFGRIVPEKAPHEAIAIARGVGRRIVLAGPVSDHDYFDRRIRPELDAQVTYAGHLPISELAALVGCSAACLVTPDWEEPFGLVAAEAMACGTPVLAFDRGGLGEVVDGIGVTVSGRDREESVDGVRRALLLDRAAVRSATVQKFSLDRMVGEYVALYGSMASERRAG